MKSPTPTPEKDWLYGPREGRGWRSKIFSLSKRVLIWIPLYSSEHTWWDIVQYTVGRDRQQNVLPQCRFMRTKCPWNVTGRSRTNFDNSVGWLWRKYTIPSPHWKIITVLGTLRIPIFSLFFFLRFMRMKRRPMIRCYSGWTQFICPFRNMRGHDSYILPKKLGPNSYSLLGRNLPTSSIIQKYNPIDTILFEVNQPHEVEVHRSTIVQPLAVKQF